LLFSYHLLYLLMLLF